MVSPVFYDDGCGLRGEVAVQICQEDCSAVLVGRFAVSVANGFSGAAGSDLAGGSIWFAVGRAMSVEGAVTCGVSWVVSCGGACWGACWGDFCMEETSRASAW